MVHVRSYDVPLTTSSQLVEPNIRMEGRTSRFVRAIIIYLPKHWIRPDTGVNLVHPGTYPCTYRCLRATRRLSHWYLI
eukprot:SAG31_NODE_482_length_15056_cov_5.057364_8_plen_78_part_00